jgi:RES domain-containing protein
MNVYRITQIQFSNSLTASGLAARWNYGGSFVIYTAESRSLACLENLVHRSGEGRNDLFKIMVIEIPDNLSVEKIELASLKKNWNSIENYSYCQSLGNKWLNDNNSSILQLPSVVMKQEHNYLINPQHPDFIKIKLRGKEDFDFDKRF